MRKATMRAAVVTICVLSRPFANAPAAQAGGVTQSEDIEPRIVGKSGTTAIGVAGFVDRFFSPEEILPGSYTVQVDGIRFVTGRFAVRGGIAGTGAFGSESSDDDRTGPGAAALHGMGGVLFYFTPRSLVSVYLGSEYWLQVTRRGASDHGSIVGKAGIHATLSSRSSVFVEAGAGTALTRGSDGELLTRFVGQIGLRIKL